MILYKTIIANIIFFTILFGEDRIAITTKIIGKAHYVRGNNSELPVTKGHIFENGDILTTSKGGFVALLYIDDKTALKVKENSKLTISGKRAAKSIAKEIKLDRGTLRAIVKKQNQNDFIIRTPVSVASVKGTDFWLISNKTNDSIIGLEGKIAFLNILSGETVDITIGKTGISSSEGSLQSFKTDPSTIPEDLSVDINGDQILEIEFENASGKKKTLIIKYK
jgi:hypothetical protein